MPSLLSYVESGWSRVSQDPLLFVFPVLATLVYPDRLGRLLSTDQVVSVQFAFPVGLGQLTTFVNAPIPPGFTISPLFFLMPLTLAVDAVLTAAFLGRLDAALQDRPRDDSAAVSRWFVPMLGLAAFDFAVLFAGVIFGVLGPLTLLLVIPAVLVVGYLFFAAPYLVVLQDRGAVDALRASKDLALERGAYRSFAVQYFVAVAVVSLPLSMFVYGAGIFGVLFGMLVTAPLAVALSAATMQFVRNLVESTEHRHADQTEWSNQYRRPSTDDRV
ncbi:hypothetical protein [Haloarchaeobius sp. DFWS5]|uniref:hypothetical protein n=1 Tax=Haloarchaeobius sp. DFWS5 TaxID=3446114 RepID=UPI003EBB89C2